MTLFQLQKPQNLRLGSWLFSLSWVFGKELGKNSTSPGVGVKTIPHPFSITGWETRSVKNSMLNSLGVENSVCSQNKTHTGLGPIGW